MSPALPVLADHERATSVADVVAQARACRICAADLPAGPRPILAATARARIAIIGQAPGRVVHQSGVPWDDASGARLRAWMGVDDVTFYDAERVAILPMGFCFPGTGKSGDLPPRPECAPLWMDEILRRLTALTCVLLVGQYAQAYFLREARRRNLTETVRAFDEYGDGLLPLPHPSPRNNIWLARNPFFEAAVVPSLRRRVRAALRV